MTETRKDPGAGRVEIRRTMDHPPETIFDAWTDGEGMSRWMRPGPTQRAEVELDVRVGGAFTIRMISEEFDIEHTGVYREVVRPRRLVFTWNAPHLPEETTVRLELSPSNGGTELLLVHEGLPDSDAVENHAQGWATIVEKLEGALAEA